MLHVSGTRIGGRGEYVPVVDGKDQSPTSFDKERAMRIAQGIAAGMAAAEEEELLAPGVYSAFVLYDDGTWQQPSFSIGRPATECEIEAALTKPKRAFYVAGLQEDSGASKECVVELKF